MLAVAQLRAPPTLFEMLAQLGYAHRPLDTIPDRLYFIQELNGLRTHHLHVCELDSTFWLFLLRFRDRLRSRPDLARSYAELKCALAAQYPNDRLAYTDAKDHFIARALAATTDEVTAARRALPTNRIPLASPIAGIGAIVTPTTHAS